MEHGNEMPEGHLHWNQNEYNDSRKDVLKTIIILSLVTITEVGVAIAYDVNNPDGGDFKWAINLFMAVASVFKVYYIMGTFMHLKHETRPFLLTVLLPFLFLVWAIVAFTLEGASWQYMRSLLNVF